MARRMKAGGTRRGARGGDRRCHRAAFAAAMRLWTLHPKYLDARGLVALWREGSAGARGPSRADARIPLASAAAIASCAHPSPVTAINAYLGYVHAEAAARGYRFDRSRIGPVRTCNRICVTGAQVATRVAAPAGEAAWARSRAVPRAARSRRRAVGESPVSRRQGRHRGVGACLTASRDIADRDVGRDDRGRPRRQRPAAAAAARLPADARDVAQGRAAAARDFTVVATDLRGYGDSSKPDGAARSRRLLEARDGAGPGRGDGAARLRRVLRRRARSRRPRRASHGARSSASA